MPSQQRLLHLDRYRRYRTGYRPSPPGKGPPLLPVGAPATPLQRRKDLDSPSKAIPSTPKGTSQRILHGILGSSPTTEGDSPCVTPSTSDASTVLRQRKLDKYRYRFRRTDTPKTDLPRTGVEFGGNRSPATPSTISESRSFSTRGSVTCIESSIISTESLEGSSAEMPIILDDVSVSNLPLYHSSSTGSVSSRPPQKPRHQEIIDVRDNAVSPPRASDEKNSVYRRDDTNTASTWNQHPKEDSIQQSASLSMPSLNSHDAGDVVQEISGGPPDEALSPKPHVGYRSEDESCLTLDVASCDAPGIDGIDVTTDSQKAVGVCEAIHSTGTPRNRSPPRDRIQIFREDETRLNPPSLDQQTVRRLYSSEFADIIARHRRDELYLEITQNDHQSLLRENNISFAVRKRPMFEDDLRRGDFDVVTVKPDDASLVVYEAHIQPDLKTKQVNQLSFGFDSVVSEYCTSEEFYQRVAQPSVLMAKNGGVATVVVFGQEESGKTYTTTDIETRAVVDIFESTTPAKEEVDEPGRPASVTVQFVEICDNTCTDMLGFQDSQVKVVDRAGGVFRFKGNVSKPAYNARSLSTIISDAKRRRAGKEKLKGDQGNRKSHTVLQINIRKDGQRGCLTILDCGGAGDNAGSIPSSPRDCVQNASLKPLFECIRARVLGKRRDFMHVPYRANNLTKILRESLQSEDSGFCVIGTISPNATDTEKTLETLQTLRKVMQGKELHNEIRQNPPKEEESPRPTETPTGTEELVLPRQWSHSELVDWLKKKNLLDNKVPADINGRFAMRMSKKQLKNTFYNLKDNAKAEKVYVALRTENDRIARLRVKRRIARDKQEAAS